MRTLGPQPPVFQFHDDTFDEPGSGEILGRTVAAETRDRWWRCRDLARALATALAERVGARL